MVKKSVRSTNKKLVKISAYNRLQAIANSPVYLKKLREYHNAESLEEKNQLQREISRKFGLPNITINSEYIKGLTLSLCFDELELKAKSLFSPVPIMPITRAEIVYSLEHEWHKKGVLVPHGKLPSRYKELLIDGKYLLLKVDLSRPKKDLINKFKDYLDLQSSIKRNKSRDKETSVDPWLVYNMNEKEGKLLKVTRKLFGVTGHPAYDKEVDRLYKLVKRAHQKALEFIKLVESTDPSLFVDI